MKRAAFLTVLLLIVGGIPFAMNAGPNPNPNKTSLCHFDDEGVGHVINVSENALPAHLDKHGDCRVDGDDFIDNGDGTCSCNAPITYTITLRATSGEAFGESPPATFTGTFVVPSSFLAQADGSYDNPPIQDFRIQLGTQGFDQATAAFVRTTSCQVESHEITDLDFALALPPYPANDFPYVAVQPNNQFMAGIWPHVPLDTLWGQYSISR